MMRKCRSLLPWAAALLIFSAQAQPLRQGERNPTPEAYVAATGATLAPAGKLEIDGRRMSCGQSATVLDTGYRDFGGALPGFLILNPNLFAGLATPVKLWIYSHECAHQSVGKDEGKADCAAVQRGRREGWLNEAGLAQVCDFMQPARADSSHFSGAQRCALMQQCFTERKDKPRR